MKKFCFGLFIIVFFGTPLFAFDEGLVLGMKARFAGSATDPHISSEELAMMKALYLKGNVGFIIHGGVDLTYIFNSEKYFGFEDNKIFGGLGAGGYLQIGQGFSGQVSGSDAGDVFVNVFFTPVVHFGASLKTYLLSNRLVIGFDLGTRLIADPTPMYDMYTSVPDDIPSEVGTIIVTQDMMEKMNPWGVEASASIEYIQPVFNTTELVLGGFISYCIYKPGYISMPPSLKKAAESQNFYPEKTPLDTFFLNSLDFGVTLGFNFKVNP